MVRLDKFLCDCGKGTRSQVKEWIRRGQAEVNGRVEKNPDRKILEEKDEVLFRGESCRKRGFAYYMLNKPAGVVSAAEDRAADTVLDFFKDVPDRDLFPAGRLDKDTTGLLLITNDGALAHRLLSPKRHVDKVYEVRLRQALSEEEIHRLEQGVDIGEEKLTLPARVEVMEDPAPEGIASGNACGNSGAVAGRVIRLTIHEGKFHQIKRMLLAVGNEVVGLKRIAFGPVRLDGDLKEGDYRELTAEEVAALKQAAGMQPDEENP